MYSLTHSCLLTHSLTHAYSLTYRFQDWINMKSRLFLMKWKVHVNQQLHVVVPSQDQVLFMVYSLTLTHSLLLTLTHSFLLTYACLSGNNDHTNYDIGKEPLTSQVAEDILNVYRKPGTHSLTYSLTHLLTYLLTYYFFRWEIKWEISHENLASCLQIL